MQSVQVAGKFFLYGEDIAGGFVGPFDSVKDAEAHLEFWKERGDAAVAEGTCKIMPGEEVVKEYWWCNLASPERDRELEVNKK